jgi:hypothetical protein
MAKMLVAMATRVEVRGPFAGIAHFMARPKVMEFRAKTGQLIHQGEKRCLVCSKAEIDAKPCEQRTGVRLPVRHRATMVTTEKHQPNDVALGWAKGCKIAEHLGVGGIPGDHIEEAVSRIGWAADTVEKGL